MGILFEGSRGIFLPTLEEILSHESVSSSDDPDVQLQRLSQRNIDWIRERLGRCRKLLVDQQFATLFWDTVCQNPAFHTDSPNHGVLFGAMSCKNMSRQICFSVFSRNLWTERRQKDLEGGFHKWGYPELSSIWINGIVPYKPSSYWGITILRKPHLELPGSTPQTKHSTFNIAAIVSPQRTKPPPGQVSTGLNQS